MKQIKFPSLDMNEAKKIAAITIFALAFFAFLLEIIHGFLVNEHLKTLANPIKIVNKTVSLNSKSALFTHFLFGEYISAFSDSDIKPSMLDAEVVGIMFSEKETDSQVIIRAGGGEEKYYCVGDTLLGGAVIKQISARQVVMLYRGVLESLSLPKNELIFAAPAKPLIEE